MIAVIGDVHAKYRDYISICQENEYTVQVGDMGFNYLNRNLMMKALNIDVNKHVFFGGNHDNYSTYDQFGIGHYGKYSLADVEFFYVRGAFSIDYKHRTHGVNWWSDEELSNSQFNWAIAEYEKVKPNIVLSHDCPISISRKIGNPAILRHFGFNPEYFQTRTGLALQSMLDVHRPKVWIFGHYHKSVDFEVEGTRFICLNELESMELSLNDLD